MIRIPIPIQVVVVVIASLLQSACFGVSSPAPAPATPPPATAPPPTGRTLRFVSLAIRDIPPTFDETARFMAGQKSLDTFISEWLASPEHTGRIARYFADFFGEAVGFTPLGNFQLRLSDNGTYHLKGSPEFGLDDKPDCTPEEALRRPAWWLDEGDTILICPESASDGFVFPPPGPDDNPIVCDSAFSQALEPACGCGDHQLLCIPCELEGSTECTDTAGRNRDLEASFNREPIERGVFVYENGLSWMDYLGGDFFYGNRALYLYYLQMQESLMSGEVSAAAAMDQLNNIPMDRPARAPWPAGFERAGLVTSPGFLNTFNTFRGRARVLSQRLLCHDVDETLNVDQYEQFINPSLTDADRAHGAREQCAFCHYGMDNQASMLLGYDIDGRSLRASGLSQLGHVFGQDDSGPSALIRGYVERGPGFNECMAKRAWASFTGLPWDTALTDADRAAFIALSRQGPRPLIRGILTSPVLRQASPAND
jgi:hypothetical protein